MSFQHNIIRGWNNGGNSLSKQASATAGAEINIDESIPASTTDGAVEFALDVSQLKSLFITADHDVVIETNSGSSPINVFTIGAGKAFAWIFGDPALRDTAGTAVTTDITSLFITNGDLSNAAIVSIRVLYDPTI